MPVLPSAPLVAPVALSVVAATGAFLFWLGCTALFIPPRAKAFLLGFAATPSRHYAELAVRAVVGIAFMLAAPGLPVSPLFLVAGVVLIGSTAVLALLPYQVHLRFAQRSVPAALPYLPIIGVVSMAAGLGVAWSVYAASVA